MAVLSGTNLTTSSGATINGAGRIVAVRFSYNSSQFSNSAQQANDWLNVEVTMPPTESDNSRYLVMAETNTDDSNSNTCGAAVETWVGVTPPGGGTENTYWVHRPGTHSHYLSGGDDKYFTLHDMHIDDGANTQTIQAGQTRRYRAYGQNHNGNIYWNAGVGGQEGARTKLIVIEFDGSLI